MTLMTFTKLIGLFQNEETSIKLDGKDMTRVKTVGLIKRTYSKQHLQLCLIGLLYDKMHVIYLIN